MAAPLAILAGFGKAAANFVSKMWEAITPKKHVEAVNDLLNEQTKIFDNMRKLITEDENISIEKKLEFMKALSMDLEERQKAACKMVNESTHESTKRVLEIMGGLFSGGATIIPQLFAMYKKATPTLTNEEIETIESKFTEEENTAH